MNTRWLPAWILPLPRGTGGFLTLQDFAVKARYSPEDTSLPASRELLLAHICQLRLELEHLPEAGQEASP